LREDDGGDRGDGGGGEEGPGSGGGGAGHVARFLTGTKPAYQNAVTAYIDVRDVARAHALVYELHDPRGGCRYLCVSAVLHRAQFVQLLQDLFPHYPVTSKYEDEGKGKPMVKPYKFSNRRLKDLGLEFTPMRESLYDTVISLQEKGHLPLPPPVPKRARL
jgi:cinnamoyl-CoA reductase